MFVAEFIFLFFDASLRRVNLFRNPDDYFHAAREGTCFGKGTARFFK
jgi:hypothetical protein